MNADLRFRIGIAQTPDRQAANRRARARLKDWEDQDLKTAALQALQPLYGGMAESVLQACALYILGSPFYELTDTDDPAVCAYLLDLAAKLSQSHILAEGEDTPAE